MYKNWIGLCDMCGEKSLVNYAFVPWDTHPEPERYVICQDRDSCVMPAMTYRKEDKPYELTPEQKEALDALPF